MMDEGDNNNPVGRTDYSSIGDNGPIDQPNDDSAVEMRQELPLLDRPQGDVSSTRTLMNFIKGMMGPGCLALPLAFKQAGLWMGLVLIFGFGALNCYGMTMLIRSAHYLCKKYAVNTVIAMLQIGIGSVLVVFISSHLKEVLEHWDSSVHMSVLIYMVIILIPLVLINFVRTLKVLAIFSIIGNIVMIVAFIIIFQKLIAPPTYIANLPAITDLGGISVACGSILYAFEGQAMVLPMENKMRKPEDMLGIFGVLSTGMAVVTLVYAATGFFGFATYGEDVEGSITLNLPNSPLYDAVKLMLSMVVYLGYSIQLYIVVEMLWPAIRRKLLGGYESFHLLCEYIFRAFLVLLTMSIAVLVPRLELIIPLVGVSSGMLLAFVFPPVIETVAFWSEWQQTGVNVKWYLLKNGILFVCGIFGLIAGLTSSLQDIFQHHSSNSTAM